MTALFRAARGTVLCIIAAVTSIAPAGAADPPTGHPSALARATFLSYQHLFEEVDAYRARLVIQQGTQRAVPYRIEAVPPDKYRVILPGDAEGVIIQDAMYIKAFGRWMPAHESFGSALGIGQWALAERGARPSSIEYMGHMIVQHEQRDFYRFMMPPDVRCKISFGRADHLPRNLACANAGLHTTVEYYDYNADITIESPT